MQLLGLEFTLPAVWERQACFRLEETAAPLAFHTGSSYPIRALTPRKRNLKTVYNKVCRHGCRHCLQRATWLMSRERGTCLNLPLMHGFCMHSLCIPLGKAGHPWRIGRGPCWYSTIQSQCDRRRVDSMASIGAAQQARLFRVGRKLAAGLQAPCPKQSQAVGLSCLLR